MTHRELIEKMMEAGAEHRAEIRNLEREESDENIGERMEQISRKYRAIYQNITDSRLRISDLLLLP